MDTFDMEMNGIIDANALGKILPDGLTAKILSDLLLPAGTGTTAFFAGAKSVPSQPDLYAAIVCVGYTVGYTDCMHENSDQKSDLAVYAALVAKGGDGVWHATAKPLLIDTIVNWRDTELHSPPAVELSGTAKISPDAFERFDLANYQISATQRAVGLRGLWEVGSSGGFAEYHALYLFTMIDGALKQILAVPISSFEDYAGDWHKDGTRDHQITDLANKVIVTSHMTDGYFDLAIKSKTSRWQKLYHWSKAASAYWPVGK